MSELLVENNVRFAIPGWADGPLIKSFQADYVNHVDCDVIISCPGDSTIAAHKRVLGSASRFFNDHLNRKCPASSPFAQKYYVVPLDEEVSLMKLLVHIVYFGSVVVKHEVLNEFKTILKKYGVTVVEFCNLNASALISVNPKHASTPKFPRSMKRFLVMSSGCFRRFTPRSQGQKRKADNSLDCTVTEISELATSSSIYETSKSSDEDGDSSSKNSTANSEQTSETPTDTTDQLSQSSTIESENNDQVSQSDSGNFSQSNPSVETSCANSQHELHEKKPIILKPIPTDESHTFSEISSNHSAETGQNSSDNSSESTQTSTKIKIPDVCSNSESYCVHCQKQMSSKQSLKRHTNVKHRDLMALFSCHMCSRKFKERRELEDHYNQDHNLAIDLTHRKSKRVRREK